MFHALPLVGFLALVLAPQGGGSSSAGGNQGNGTPVPVSCKCTANASNSYSNDSALICRDGSIVFSALRISKEKGVCLTTPTGCNDKESPCTAEQEVIISFSGTATPCVTSLDVEGGGFPSGAVVNSSQSATLSAEAACGLPDTDKVTVSFSAGGSTHSFWCQLDLTCNNCNS